MFYPPLLLLFTLLLLANVHGQNGTAEPTTPLPITTPAGHAGRPTVGMGQLMSGQQQKVLFWENNCFQQHKHIIHRATNLRRKREQRRPPPPGPWSCSTAPSLGKTKIKPTSALTRPIGFWQIR